MFLRHFVFISISAALTFAHFGDDPTHPKDCGGDDYIAHFHNVNLAFFDEHGKPTNTIQFPGKLKITSGQICFTDGQKTHDLMDAKLQIKLEKKEWGFWTDMCSILENFVGGSPCTMELCGSVETSPGADICSALSAGTCFSVTYFYNKTIKLPKIPSIFDHGKFKLTAKLVAKGGQNVACLREDLEL